MLTYQELIKHKGHNITVRLIQETAVLVCETCHQSLIVSQDETVTMPVRPFPKSSTKGGKVR